MHGANGSFVARPKVFLETNVVDNINWLREAGKPVDTVNRRLVFMADALKEANFDLVCGKDSQGMRVYDLRLCCDRTDNDVPIRAYWCPFVQGDVLPGYVDIPRKNPEYQFLFTPAMNGCSFDITDSPNGADMMRVYHNQHPDSKSIKREIGKDPISTFSFDEYGTKSNPNAFNLMQYRDDGWHYISQPQQFTYGTRSFGVAYRSGESVKIKPVFGNAPNSLI